MKGLSTNVIHKTQLKSFVSCYLVYSTHLSHHLLHQLQLLFYVKRITTVLCQEHKDIKSEHFKIYEQNSRLLKYSVLPTFTGRCLPDSVTSVFTN